MPNNLIHIASSCLSIAKITSLLITKTIIGVLLISFLKTFFVYLKTFLFKKQLTVVKTPKTIIELIQKYNLQDSVLIIDDQKPTAFCLGVKKPVIYISTGLVSLLNKKELEAVLLHEKYHYLRHDTLWIFVISSIQEFFFFIPVLSDMFGGIIRKREALADQFTIQKLGSNKAILQSFRKLISLRSSTIFPFDYIPSFSHGHTIEYRIKAIRGQNSVLISLKIKHIVITFLFISFFFIPLLLPSSKSQASEKHYPKVCLKGTSCHVDCSSI